MADEGITENYIVGDGLLSETYILYDLLFCDDSNCSNERHLQEISNCVNNVIHVLQTAVEDYGSNIK